MASPPTEDASDGYAAPAPAAFAPAPDEGGEGTPERHPEPEAAAPEREAAGAVAPDAWEWDASAGGEAGAGTTSEESSIVGDRGPGASVVADSARPASLELQSPTDAILHDDPSVVAAELEARGIVYGAPAHRQALAAAEGDAVGGEGEAEPSSSAAPVEGEGTRGAMPSGEMPPSAPAPSESEARALEEIKEIEPWSLPPEEPAPQGSGEAVAAALQRVAERVRRGELALPPDASAASDEVALAVVLAALLRAPGR
jgi:hypothetical protein